MIEEFALIVNLFFLKVYNQSKETRLKELIAFSQPGLPYRNG